MTIDEAIKLLHCANINIDNAKRMGVAMLEIAQMQLKEAIDGLEKINDREENRNDEQRGDRGVIR